MHIWFKKVNSHKKLPISDGESFLHKTVKSGILTQLTCFIFPLKIGEMLWNYTKCQKVKVWRRLGRFKTKNLFAQTILCKIFGTK